MARPARSALGLPLALTGVGLLSLAAAAAVPTPQEVEFERPQRLTPPRPDGGVVARDGDELRRLLGGATPGTTIVLEPGAYVGPFVLGPGVTVWGPHDAVLTSGGEGTTVRLSGEDCALLGVTVDGSGGRYDLLDAAVRVEGDGARVEGLLIHDALYGIVVEKSKGVVIRGNHVRGSGLPMIGERGDGLRVWETYDSVIADNWITDSRDMVIWYSSRNRITGNTVERSRYGTHFMYSHENEVRGNRYRDNVVGIFSMYAHDLDIEDNLLAGSAGAAGIGLGIKESSDLVVRNNLFLHDERGLYVDTSPFQPGSRLVVEHNGFRLCGTAIAFHSAPKGGEFRRNLFRDCTLLVQVDGGGDASGAVWGENDWDAYRGYDLDGDGWGDVPFELRSATAQAVSNHAELAFLRGTPAFLALDAVTEVLPLYRPETVLTDPRPAWDHALSGRRTR